MLPTIAFQEKLQKLINKLVYSLPEELHAKLGYLVEGKKIRSRMMYECSKILNVDSDEIITPAAALEIIHTISLLHDDVIDSTKKRRGYDTLNQLLNEEVSVWSGDALLFHLLDHFSDYPSDKLRKEMLGKILDLFKGEFFQDSRLSLGDLKKEKLQDKSSEELFGSIYPPYLEVVRKKTGSLFSVAYTSPAILKNKPQDEINFYEECGYTLGMAFQLIDDCNDLEEDIKTKISDSQLTLPVLIWQIKYSTEQNGKINKKIKSNITKEVIWVIDELSKRLGIKGKSFIKNDSDAKKIYEYTLEKINYLKSL